MMRSLIDDILTSESAEMVISSALELGRVPNLMTKRDKVWWEADFVRKLALFSFYDLGIMQNTGDAKKFFLSKAFLKAFDPVKKMKKHAGGNL